MPTIELADVTIGYDVAGAADADPIVLICGCGAPALGWFALVPPLVDAGYRVVTFDNRGVAPSSAPPAPYSVDAIVGDTLALCDHLGIERARFAGHSMGGWVAETLATHHPERVQAAALMGSCNRPTAWEKAITTVERDLARLDAPLPSLFYACETLRYLPNKDLQDNELVDTWLALIGDNPPWPNPGRLGQCEACYGWSFNPEHGQAWPTISVPVLVLGFEHDIDSPPAYAREAAALIPGARYVEVPDSSHIGIFTHADQVAALLIEFFATT